MEARLPSDKGDSMARWYVLLVWGGSENIIKAQLEERIRVLKMEKDIQKVLVPVRYEAVVKKKEVYYHQQKMTSGYMFIRMNLTVDTFPVIKSMNNILSFLGDPTPSPVPVSQMVKLLESMRIESDKTKEVFVPELGEGDKVAVLTGPFKNTVGIIDVISNNKASVKIPIFGRMTNARVDVENLEKCED